MRRPIMWVCIASMLFVWVVCCSRAHAVDEKQFTLLLENNQWLRNRLDKTEKEQKELQAENAQLKETLTKALEANHRLAAHIRGESVETPKPATAGTPATPATPGSDTKVNTNTNVKIVDLSVLSPRVDTKTETVDDPKDAKPAPAGQGDAAKPTETRVNTDTNVSIFDLSLLSPRVKTDTTTSSADQATIKALQDAVILRDKLIVGRDQIIVKRDVEIARLRVLLLQKGINPDAR